MTRRCEEVEEKVSDRKLDRDQRPNKATDG